MNMRFLGIGDSCDLLAMYRGLLADGHEVKVAVKDPLCHGTGAGMIERTEDWSRELEWIRQAGRDGIILFENISAGLGADQDALRAQGFNVIGGSAYGDRLENDRAYAQSVLARLGLPICQIQEFDDGARALDFLDAHPRRFVLKFNGQGASSSNSVGRFDDGRDVRAVLAAKLASLDDQDQVSFVLMEHVKGVEMGVGAYFNGNDFLRPACLDWEHKRFFAGDLGELTGEMGTVATYDRTNGFFDHTLGRMAPLLRRNGYCGYINLNTIVNEDGIWPLEFTCRFGYPGFAILDPLQASRWASIFQRMVRRDKLEMETRPGFVVGIVVTTPPFPYNLKRVDEIVGLPVLFDGDLSVTEKAHLHYGEIGLANGQLVTTGAYGWTMVVTGCGQSIESAKSAAYDLVNRLYVPNMRYRLDIGDRLIAGGFSKVEQLGLLDPA
jgi:phosphoribosylamine--glycine ligase